MSDNVWPVPIQGQRAKQQAVTESERESSTVMHFQLELMGELENRSAEPFVYGRRRKGIWK